MTTAAEHLTKLNLSSLPLTVTVTTDDIRDILSEMETDTGLRNMLNVAIYLRQALVTLEVTPLDAMAALGLAAGLISKIDLHDQVSSALTAMATPIVLGHLNGRDPMAN
jgi:hypothetical protein